MSEIDMKPYDRFDRIDWLSFSFQGQITEEPGRAWMDDNLGILEEKTEIITRLLATDEPEIGNGRRPYAVSIRNRYVTVYMSPQMEWSLVEVNGAGCKLLTEHTQMRQLIAAVVDRVTRVDVCTDYLVGSKSKVRDFVDAGYSSRFKTVSWVTSGTGDTFYIGSRSSERLCRIYQYAAPHPRHQLLRIEFELKGDRAKQMADLLCSITPTEAANGLAVAYGFESDIWHNNEAPTAQFAPIQGKQRHNSTISWFYTQVVPAIKKLHSEGVIDSIEEFLAEAFADDDENALT